jgi:hypothetical protein
MPLTTVDEQIDALIDALKWVIERAAKLERIENAIREYHYALDNRKHGGVAKNKAFDEICTILNMHWKG